MKWARASGVRVLGIAVALAIMVAVILDLAGVKNWRTQAAAAIAVAAAAVLGNVVKEWLSTSLSAWAETQEVSARAIFMPGGRLRRVSEITDPISVGVRPASPRTAPGDGRADRVPVYVRRDVDGELRAALAGGGFVVLVGDATAGKTRSAFEAMKTVLPDHRFIAPTKLQDVTAAVQKAATKRNCVLWLDNLQHFLGPGGLTRKEIAELLDGPDHHRVVLATLRATDESRLAVGAGSATEQLVHIGQGVVDQVHHRVFVERLFTPGELARANELARQDSRLADAVNHAGNCGVGEYLACGPQLYADWQGAWSRGNRPRGAALITAAVDCRRAGFTGPLPRLLLDEIHAIYIDQRGGSQLYPETLAQAWDWAVMPRESGSAPLRYIDTDRCDVFDYLIDEFQRRAGEWAPPDIVRAALSYAGPEDASMIAAAAWRQGRYELAEIAIRKVYDSVLGVSASDHRDALAARNNLAVVLHAQRRLDEAEAEYRAILHEMVATLGTDHPEMLAVRNNRAAILHSQGRLTEAEGEYRAILRVRTQILGTGHAETLAVRNNLAVVLHAQRRLTEARAEYLAILEARTEVLSDDHPSTLLTRNNHAVVLADLGLLDEAEAEYRAVLDLRTSVLGADHPHTKISRENLASLLARRSAG